MQASTKMKVVRKEEVFFKRKKYLGNGIGIDVLTTHKPGSPSYTTCEFVGSWAGERSLEQLHKEKKKKEERKINLLHPTFSNAN